MYEENLALHLYNVYKRSILITILDNGRKSFLTLHQTLASTTILKVNYNMKNEAILVIFLSVSVLKPIVSFCLLNGSFENS